MERWDVVIVITALVALFAAIITPIIKLNTTITKLNSSIDSLGDKMNDISCENKHQHDNLFGITREHDKTLDDHNTRIVRLEERTPKKAKA